MVTDEQIGHAVLDEQRPAERIAAAKALLKDAWDEGREAGLKDARPTRSQDMPRANPYEAKVEDCAAVGFSGEGRCLETATVGRYCTTHAAYVGAGTKEADHG